MLLDNLTSAIDEKEFMIGCILNALHAADVQKLKCVYQFVLHIVK